MTPNTHKTIHIWNPQGIGSSTKLKAIRNILMRDITSSKTRGQ